MTKILFDRKNEIGFEDNVYSRIAIFKYDPDYKVASIFCLPSFVTGFSPPQLDKLADKLHEWAERIRAQK